jgi:hypothetical protein
MSAPTARHAHTMPLPRLTVGYLQSEGEMLKMPDQDLASFFSRGNTWKADLFTGRRVRALLEVAPTYDCVVVGYNAFYDSPSIRAGLGKRLPQTGVLVLHQLVNGPLPFLGGDLGLDVADNPEEKGRILPSQRLGTGEDVRTESEVLLNWPRRIDVPRDQPTPWAWLERTLVPASGSVWRSVLEVEQSGERYPILVRTPGTQRPATVVSSLILDYDREDHRDLLTNMLVFCALGLPETAVVGIADDAERGLLKNKLRLQGAAAVETGELDFDAWPARGAREVVLPRGLTVENAKRASGAIDWLAAGGLLMTLDEEGRPSLTSGASDAAWVAQRWASWFAGADPESWQARIGRCHAVLSVLERLHALDPDARANALQLSTPQAYAPQVRTFLRGRLKGKPHCENTISATAAVYELHTLVGGALSRRHARAVDEWLRSRFDSAYDVDRLTIARAVADPDLLERAVRSLDGKPLSPVIVAHLCEAALAAGRTLPPLAEASDADVDELESSLDGALILSARYLAAVSAYTAAHPGEPVPGVRPEAVDRAISTVREFGVLADLGGSARPEEIDSEQVSHEALALLEYFALSPTPTAPLSTTRSGISAAVAEYLVRESERLRSSLAAEAAAAARVRGQASVLRQLLGLAAVGAGAGSYFAFNLALDIGLSTAFAALVFAAAAGGLGAVGWGPRWLELVLTVFKGGVGGASSALAGLFTAKRRGPSDGEPG